MQSAKPQPPHHPEIAIPGDEAINPSVIKHRRQLGTLAGVVRVPGDFDDMLADEIIDLFEGR